MCFPLEPCFGVKQAALKFVSEVGAVLSVVLYGTTAYAINLYTKKTGTRKIGLIWTGNHEILESLH